MFNRKEKASIVSQLKEEVGKPSFSPVDSMGMFMGFTPFFTTKEKSEEMKMFAELLESYFEEYLEDNYKECSDCGCLIAEDKAQFVTRGNEKIAYCKHCKPDYDEIVTEYDDDECEMRDAGIGRMVLYVMRKVK